MKTKFKLLTDVPWQPFKKIIHKATNSIKAKIINVGRPCSERSLFINCSFNQFQISPILRKQRNKAEVLVKAANKKGK